MQVNDMGTLTKETSKMLIKESKEDLRLYHINLQKYKASVVQNEDDVTATVTFTSKVSGRSIYAECYYNNEEVLQCGIYL